MKTTNTVIENNTAKATSIVHTMSFNDKAIRTMIALVRENKTMIFTRSALKLASQRLKDDNLRTAYALSCFVKNHALLISVNNEVQRGIYRLPVLSLPHVAKLLSKDERDMLKANRDAFMKTVVSRARARAIASATIEETVDANEVAESTSEVAESTSEVADEVIA
jgi:hypothetical protein